MKSITLAVLLLLTITPCLSAGEAQTRTVAPGVKSTYDTAQAAVVKVYGVMEGPNKFIAYMVKWKGIEVIVSDPLAQSQFKVGDIISFLVQRVQMEKATNPIHSL